MADVARRELIGRFVTVRSPEKGMDGMEGRIVDETKQTFLVEVDAPRRVSPGTYEVPGPASKAVKRVPKPGNRFAFHEGAHAIVVDGDDITFQPEDRTKKVRG